VAVEKATKEDVVNLIKRRMYFFSKRGKK